MLSEKGSQYDQRPTPATLAMFSFHCSHQEEDTDHENRDHQVPEQLLLVKHHALEHYATLT